MILYAAQFRKLTGFALTAGVLLAEPSSSLPYTVISTGQTICYDNHQAIAPPTPSEPFYGQDAQTQTHPASYTLSPDGLTVRDNVTNLVWQSSPDTDGDSLLTRHDKLTLSQALELPAKLNAARFGRFTDWRLPSIKELYSLFDARDTDPSGYTGTDTSGLTPFIDTHFFKFAYGNTRTGDRIIDSQYASNTKYVGKSARGFDKLFGVNFADGRIKGYDLQMPGGRAEKIFFVQCVRGNPSYGKNDFNDNHDGTITDNATGLMWARTDSGKGLDWPAALAWVQTQNAQKYLGHRDWRLPNIKELHSIVDYTRSPDTTHSPAIDPLFTCTHITNEGGQPDYPCYWSSTTHASYRGGNAAMYFAFGRAGGWMTERSLTGGPPPDRGPPRSEGMEPPEGTTGNYDLIDVHGAGAQRSDPKVGDPAQFPHGRGPQGDVIRIYNYARLVRDITK